MGKNDANKRFVRDAPAVSFSTILSLVVAIAIVGGLAYYLFTEHGDALSLPSEAEIAKIHSDAKKA